MFGQAPYYICKLMCMCGVVCGQRAVEPPQEPGLGCLGFLVEVLPKYVAAVPLCQVCQFCLFWSSSGARNRVLHVLRMPKEGPP